MGIKLGAIPAVSVSALAVAAIILFSMLILSTRLGTVDCTEPYKKIGNSCCIDQNKNNLCDASEEFCGDGACDSSESCSSCARDCGGCPVVTSPEQAIDLASNDKRSSLWGAFAENISCDPKYLSLKDSVFFVSRVSAPDRSIECTRLNHFSGMAEVVKSASDPEGIGLMESCSKDLIPNYNTEIRGIISRYSYMPPLEEHCTKCTEYYAIHVGCFNKTVEEGIMAGNIPPNSLYSIGVIGVDALTGNVYY